MFRPGSGGGRSRVYGGTGALDGGAGAGPVVKMKPHDDGLWLSYYRRRGRRVSGRLASTRAARSVKWRARIERRGGAVREGGEVGVVM